MRNNLKAGKTGLNVCSIWVCCAKAAVTIPGSPASRSLALQSKSGGDKRGASGSHLISCWRAKRGRLPGVHQVGGRSPIGMEAGGGSAAVGGTRGSGKDGW